MDQPSTQPERSSSEADELQHFEPSAPPSVGSQRVIEPLPPHPQITIEEEPEFPEASHQPVANFSPPPQRPLVEPPAPSVTTPQQPPTEPHTAVDKPSPSNGEHQVLKTLIIVLSIAILIPPVLSLTHIAQAISFGAIGSHTIAIGYVADVFYIALGLGLLLRKEIARIAYVVVACLSLVLLVFGTIKLISNEHKSQAPPGSSVQVQVQYDIAYCLGQPPSQTRDQIVQELQANMGSHQLPARTCNGSLGVIGNQLVGLIPAYLIVVVPLVFLSRRQVKALFT
jgi:hypothetical protein